MSATLKIINTLHLFSQDRTYSRAVWSISQQVIALAAPPGKPLRQESWWYFASQIAASDVKLRRALADDAYARDLVERHINQLQSTVLHGARQAAINWTPDKPDPQHPQLDHIRALPETPRLRLQ